MQTQLLNYYPTSGVHRAGEGACITPYTHNVNGEIQTWQTLTVYIVATKYGAKRISSIDLMPRLSTRTQTIPWLVFRLTPASLLEWFHVCSRLSMQIVEETVTYGWRQGTSPYLVVTIYSKRPPC